MTEVERNAFWSDFLAAWPAERVRRMTLEEYTNPGKDDAFIYWLEARTDKLGSMWGGSAFKFGIYYQANVKTKPAEGGRAWGKHHAWLTKYGADEARAFATIRARLVEVIDAVQAANLARIDEIELPPMLKWKVAFLYQDRTAPVLFPVFLKEALLYHYRALDPNAKLGSTPYHVMYQTLFERNRTAGDVFEVAEALWRGFEARKNKGSRAWAVPLLWTVDTAAVDTLCGKKHVEPEDVDSFLENLLSTADLSEGDQLALLVDGNVRALGTLTGAEPAQYSWDQVPVDFPSGLLVNPTSEIKELDATERDEIWSHLPPAETPKTGAPRYWKIAPGENAVAWPEWEKRGIAAVGWPALGDLTGLSKEEFEKLAARSAKAHGYTKGMYQAWTFRGIQPGDRVVANRGTRTVLGIGTVVKGYHFAPGTHEVNAEDFPHQIGVRWDDTAPRTVEKPGWFKTILPLSREDFEEILSFTGRAPPTPGTSEPPAPPPAVQPPAAPCEPRNVILYGPPGTGKTYATRRRALELILGAETIRDMRDDKLKALYDEKTRDGQIELVTFHQSYGYEEFVEGIRPVLHEGADSEVRYELHDGVFKRMALRAAAEGLRTEAVEPDFDELWETLTRQLAEEDGSVATSQSSKTYKLELSSRGNVLVRPCEVDKDGNVKNVADTHQVASRDNAKIYWKFRAEIGPEPDKLSYEKTTALFTREKGGSGGNHYTALWLVYAQLFALSRGFAGRRAEIVDRRARVQQALDKPGPTTTFSFSAKSPQFVLIVDEINRGNMSKIFGELITLIEADKRLTAKNELKPLLSYSPSHRFAVPPNLHVLGTMNTADRSIALMDVALRRRFTFEELMPNKEVIRAELTKEGAAPPLVDLVVDLFGALNDRIRFLYDRDHQLGHSYFLEVRDLESLRGVILDRVLPMLQEYFYGAWDKICIVLGCPYTDAGEPKRTAAHLLHAKDKKAYAQPLVVAQTFREVQTLGFDHEDYEDRLDYQVNPGLRGGFSAEELARAVLGVLDLDAAKVEERVAALVPSPAPAS